MKNKILILFMLSSLYSCRNYESRRYMAKEDEAIDDIIFQLINSGERFEYFYFDSTIHSKIFLISLLDTILRDDISEPYGFTVSVNGVRLPESEIEEGRRIYEEGYRKYRAEYKLFAPLKNGLLKQRKLDYKFKHQNLQVELIIERSNNELKENEFGYLYLSRLIFNRCYTKGYLSYMLICGDACAWSGNIEIVKIKGKWIITKYFRGGFA